MAHLKNHTNEYQGQLVAGLFDHTPKSVLAAIAISALTCGGDQLEQATSRLVTEWHVLHLNGIVPQQVPARFRQYINEGQA